MAMTLDVNGLRKIYPPAQGLAVAKTRDRLDRHSRAFIERSPFLCIATADAQGNADVSPRGDPKGFVQILDDRTLLIPDRPGNNRLDTMENIAANPNVALIFFVPGFDETLRVNGQARIVGDPALLEPAAIQGRTPKSGIEVKVREVFLHCAKALKRSHLWDSTQREDRAALPTLAQMVLEQTSPANKPPSVADIAAGDAHIEQDYQQNLY
jgi:PPOX class probable FMN-dependent enzyme